MGFYLDNTVGFVGKLRSILESNAAFYRISTAADNIGAAVGGGT